MRIGIDIQTLETAERNRGIGRLCRDTVSLLANHAKDHELVLFGFGESPPESVSELIDERVQYAQIRAGGSREEHLRLGVCAPFLWSTPEARLLDRYHVTSPMMPDILLPSSGACPIIATLLDAIPAVMHERGSPIYDDAAWARYQMRAAVLGTYQGFAAISASAADDCRQLLELPEDRISVTWVPVENLPKGRPTVASIGDLRTRLSLPDGFVLSVSGFNPRKNLSGTFRIYSKLPAALRKLHPLVLVCSLQPEERAHLEAEAVRLGIDGDVRLTGYVSDGELAVLLGEATVMLFPSQYEGFGIPIAEAMAHGTAVVTCDVSSLPEVAGDAAVLYRPGDEDGMADGVRQIIENNELRSRLVARGFQQVARFSPEKFLGKLLHAYAILEKETRGFDQEVPVASVENGRLKVAVIGPLPPQMSGIADYNERLILHLLPHCDVTCYVENTQPGNPLLTEKCTVRDLTSFRREPGQFDSILYHVGNNVLHASVLPFVVHHPGVAVLHDGSLLGLYRHLARVRGERQWAREEFTKQYDAPSGEVWETEAALDGLDFLEFGMNREIVARSHGVVVHSDWLRREILKHCPDREDKLKVIPLAVDPAYSNSPRLSPTELKARYLLPPDAFVILSIGVINRLKRLDIVLEAFHNLLARHPDSILVFAGPGDPLVVKQLMEYCGQQGIKHSVRFLGHRSMPELYDVISMADVCVNLRYPTLGESSATLAMTMAMGKAVLLTPVGQFLEYPDDVCWKVRLGEDEKRDLVEYFRYLLENPEVREALGARAKEFVAPFAWEYVAQMYYELLAGVARGNSRGSGL
ncbi:MAG: glycosyltransferase [Candidatus Sumerlaeaceae bacterium]|nr:glycosyltransferase [Candidatus Sumerlaeaceae bacterium]